MNNSIFERERNFISTLISCNKILSEKINQNTLGFQHSFIKLYESILDESITENNVNIHNEIKFENFIGNRYAYFNSVRNFIKNTEFSSDFIKPLNESIVEDSFNISNFKKLLDDVINDLSKINEFEKLDSLPPEIKKIKLFSNSPINVNGFNISSNLLKDLTLQKIISEKFNLTINDLISLIYDKSNKQLLFIYQGFIITYIIKNNEFNEYNSYWNSEDSVLIINNIDKINAENYFNFLKENLNNNFVEIYKNIDKTFLNLKFTDNLYRDNERIAAIINNEALKNKNKYNFVNE